MKAKSKTTKDVCPICKGSGSVLIRVEYYGYRPIACPRRKGRLISATPAKRRKVTIRKVPETSP